MEHLTENDRELIDLAQSTTYPDTIQRHIDKADTERAKVILIELMNDCETEWEEPSRR